MCFAVFVYVCVFKYVLFVYVCVHVCLSEAMCLYTSVCLIVQSVCMCTYFSMYVYLISSLV